MPAEPDAASDRATRRLFARDPVALAERLIGCVLVRTLPADASPTGTQQVLAGTIVETEAYLGAEDKGSHSFGNRRTPRTEPMFGPAGTSYVYFTYGMHHCMNIVAGRIDEPVGVLIRALEPVAGVDVMRTLRDRGSTRRARTPLRETQLCSGPARLCQAMAIDRRHSGLDLVAAGSPLAIVPRRPMAPGRLVSSPRVGLSCAGRWKDAPLRRHLRGSAHVSRP